MATVSQAQAMLTYGAILDKINEATDAGDTERRELGVSMLRGYGENALLVGVPVEDLVEMTKRLRTP